LPFRRILRRKKNDDPAKRDRQTKEEEEGITRRRREAASFWKRVRKTLVGVSLEKARRSCSTCDSNLGSASFSSEYSEAKTLSNTNMRK
jgi:hypothetical protein